MKLPWKTKNWEGVGRYSHYAYYAIVGRQTSAPRLILPSTPIQITVESRLQFLTLQPSDSPQRPHCSSPPLSNCCSTDTVPSLPSLDHAPSPPLNDVLLDVWNKSQHCYCHSGPNPLVRRKSLGLNERRHIHTTMRQPTHTIIHTNILNIYLIEMVKFEINPSAGIAIVDLIAWYGIKALDQMNGATFVPLGDKTSKNVFSGAVIIHHTF